VAAAHTYLAIMHERLGQLQAAAASYRRAGEIYAAAGRPDRAALMQQALRRLASAD
jgi:hypothetical protein